MPLFTNVITYFGYFLALMTFKSSMRKTLPWFTGYRYHNYSCKDGLWDSNQLWLHAIHRWATVYYLWADFSFGWMLSCQCASNCWGAFFVLGIPQLGLNGILKEVDRISDGFGGIISVVNVVIITLTVYTTIVQPDTFYSTTMGRNLDLSFFIIWGYIVPLIFTFIFILRRPEYTITNWDEGDDKVGLLFKKQDYKSMYQPRLKHPIPFVEKYIVSPTNVIPATDDETFWLSRFELKVTQPELAKINEDRKKQSKVLGLKNVLGLIFVTLVCVLGADHSFN